MGDYDAIGILIEARRSCDRPNFMLKISHAIEYLRDRERYRKTPRVNVRKAVSLHPSRGHRFMSPKGAL